MVDSKRTTTKRKGNPNWKKGGPSPNPKGAPKRGQSWKEIIQEIGEMTPDEARQISKKLFEQINLHDPITLKQAVVMRVFAALLFEPQPGLLNAFMERVEGKVAQPLTNLTDDELRNFIASELGINLPSDSDSETARDNAAADESSAVINVATRSEE